MKRVISCDGVPHDSRSAAFEEVVRRAGTHLVSRFPEAQGYRHKLKRENPAWAMSRRPPLTICYGVRLEVRRRWLQGADVILDASDETVQNITLVVNAASRLLGLMAVLAAALGAMVGIPFMVFQPMLPRKFTSWLLAIALGAVLGLIVVFPLLVGINWILRAAGKATTSLEVHELGDEIGGLVQGLVDGRTGVP
jgi:hypothetical protein